MRHFSILLVLFLSILNVSCLHEKKNDSTIKYGGEGIELNLQEFRELAKETSSVIEEIEIFQLETNSESLIGTVNKVLVTDQQILVLDAQNTSAVFVFDQVGKFIRKIDREGNGPGEYSFLGDMDLDCRNNLYFLDLRKMKVLKYLLDGSFIGEDKFGFLTDKFGVLGEGTYLFDQGTRKNVNATIDLDYKLITWVASSQTLNKFIKYSEIYDSYFYPLPSPYNLYRSGDELYYLRPYEYTIYRPISEEEIVEKYRVDFGKYQVPKSFYSGYSDDGDGGKFMFDLQEKDYAHSIFSVFETSKYFCFNFQAGKKTYWVGISKLDNSISVRDISLIDLGDYPFALTPSAVVGDQFISILSPEIVEYLTEKWGKEKMKSVGLTILAEYDFSQNPILIKWSLKDSI